jgi:hypothetical protein
MSQPPKIVRRNLKGQTPSGYIWGRLAKGDGPAELLPMTQVRDALLGPGGLARYIGGRVAAAGGGGSEGFWPYAPGVPEISSWTIANGTGLTLQEATPAGGVTKCLAMTAGPSGVAHNIMSIYRPAPTTLPYLLATAITVSMNSSATPGGGIGFWSSSKLENVKIEANGTFVYAIMSRYDNATTYNSSPTFFQIFLNGAAPINLGIVWLGILVTSTSVAYVYSTDGITWNGLGGMDYTKSGSFMSSVGWDNISAVLSNGYSAGGNVANTLYCWDEDGLNRTPVSVFG